MFFPTWIITCNIEQSFFVKIIKEGEKPSGAKTNREKIMCTKRIRFVRALFSLFIIWTLTSSVALLARAEKSVFENKNEQSTVSNMPDRVYLGGFPFGTRIKTDGVIIVDTRAVDSTEGILTPALDAGFEKGDVILSVNDKKVETTSEVSDIIENSLGTRLVIEIRRDGKILKKELVPVLSRDGKSYKSGLYIRDGAAGIGTVTYVKEDKSFAGLGHGIADADTGSIIPCKSGEVFPVSLFGIVKGESGKAGELRGSLGDTPSGTLSSNRETGVFGSFNTLPEDRPFVEVGKSSEVEQGVCKIYTTLDNGTRPVEADAKIVKILDSDAHVKNFVVEITDPALLEKTGGIVQGMSGSPIIQNGKLIGAVTHVFINEPARGYGIFIENMLLETK